MLADRDTQPACQATRDPARLPLPAPLVGVAVVCIVLELTLTAADARLIGSPLWRSLAYQYGAFWAGLLGNWTPNYPAQPWLMFFTYSFLHAGPGHLAGNMVTLFALGTTVARLAGRCQTVAVYVVSMLGGAAAFGLLGTAAQPMVGASGALFGLAGAWQYHDFTARRAAGDRLWPVAQVLIGLVLLNVVLWLAMAGRLAWETHLGGFLAGGAAAAVLHRR